MKTKDIIDEFETCDIRKDGENATPYIEVFKELENLEVQFRVKISRINPFDSVRSVNINISGTLPPTKSQQEVIDKLKEEIKNQKESPKATMGGP